MRFLLSSQIPAMLFSKDRSEEESKGVPNEKINIDDALSNLFYSIHQSMENKFLTPRRYLVLLETYREVYLTKQHAIIKRQKHLKSGVSKLNDARKVVDDLKRNAEVKQKALAVKQHEADEALKQITKSMAVRKCIQRENLFEYISPWKLIKEYAFMWYVYIDL